MGTTYSPSLYGNNYSSQGQYNMQPFPLSGQSGNAGSSDSLNEYFGGMSNGYYNGYQNNYNLGVTPASSISIGSTSGNSGNSSSSSSTPLPDGTVLARFQGLENKLDTQVNSNADQKIDVNDLQNAESDTSGKYSDSDKQVIQAMLDNQDGLRGKIDHLDGQDDGTMTFDSINKMVVNPNAQYTPPKTPEQQMTNTQALNTLADYMGTAIHLDKAGHKADEYVDKHGKLVASQRGAWTTDRGKLQKMADDPDVPDNVRTAAKKMLTNTKLAETVDTAHKGGDPDGKYSIKDFQDAINKNPDIDSIGEDTTTINTGTATGPGTSTWPYISPPPTGGASGATA